MRRHPRPGRRRGGWRRLAEVALPGRGRLGRAPRAAVHEAVSPPARGAAKDHIGGAPGWLAPAGTDRVTPTQARVQQPVSSPCRPKAWFRRRLQYYQSSGKGTWNVPVNATQPQRRQLRRPPLARTGGELRPFRAVTATAGLAMVKDKKVDVIARDYTINLHKALHGMYAAPTPHSSSLGLGCAAPCAAGRLGSGRGGTAGRAAPRGPRPHRQAHGGCHDRGMRVVRLEPLVRSVNLPSSGITTL